MDATQLVLLIVFGAFSLLNLVAIQLKMRKVQYFSTPLRVPILAAFYILASASPSWLIIAALAFAFVGDIFWFLQKKEAFMMLMAGAYLLSFVFYALAFLQPFSALQGVPAWHYALGLVYAAFFVLFYMLLKPYVGDMKVPMAVYFAIVLIMGFAALTRLWWRQGLAFWLPFVGSLSYIASETVHGFHMFKYHSESKYGELFGDLLYISAHLLIVLGFMRI
jgi:uncharacterized membrane protein YhhN